MKKTIRKIVHEYRSQNKINLLFGMLEVILISLISRLPKVYWKIMPYYYKKRASNDVYKYRFSPEPFKIVYVNPKEIQKISQRKNRQKNKRTTFGVVSNGDWDQNCTRIEELPLYQIAKKHFINEIAWEDITEVQRKIQKAERGEYSTWKYNSKMDVTNRFKQFDELYELIKSQGYSPQHEIVNKSEPGKCGLFLDTLDEIAVDVGRNGELLHADGIHRLIIAKILDIDKIPIVFLVRHKKWMEHREQLCKSNDVIPDHPDLRDLK